MIQQFAIFIIFFFLKTPAESQRCVPVGVAGDCSYDDNTFKHARPIFVINQIIFEDRDWTTTNPDHEGETFHPFVNSLC